MKKIISSFLIVLCLGLLFSCGDSSGSGGDPDQNTTVDPPVNPPVDPPIVPISPTGSKIADHVVINMIREGTMPVSAIQNAKANLVIGYGHTSHGSQLSSGMEGLVAFANGSGCNGAYSDPANQNLFAFNADGSYGALHLYEGGGGSSDLSLDCGYYNMYDEINDDDLTFEEYVDAQNNGVPIGTNWAYETRMFLGEPDAQGRGSDNPAYNVIIWSWCGQAAWYSEQEIIDKYLAPMEQLEQDYPGITFVYMTCHLNGTGLNGNLNRRNEQIRAFCIGDPADPSDDKWLFDFADIESFDPDGIDYRNYLPTDGCIYDANGNGTIERYSYTDSEGNVHYSETEPINGDANWATDWQNSHLQNTDWYDCGAAHSVSLNANMKAYAAWWLWCRIAGWNNINQEDQ